MGRVGEVEPSFTTYLIMLVWMSCPGWLVGWKQPNDGSTHANCNPQPFNAGVAYVRNP